MISVVVPAYNEEEVITDFIYTFFRDFRPASFELIVVDDGSTDRTKEILERLSKKHKQLKVISYSPNRGLGHALKTGISSSRGKIIVTMDSDLSHPPSMIPDLLKELDGHQAVIGSRYISAKRDSEYNHYMLSRLTNYFTRMVTATSHVKDVTSGFRAYKASSIRKISTREKGFEVEIEILVKLLKEGAKVKEIPIPLIDRLKGESKFTMVRNGPRYVFSLAKIFFYRWL